MRRLRVLFLLLASPLLLGLTSEASVRRTEILWDTWGVPHIFARNEQDLFYAFGWAQAQSHGDLILRLYGRARGRAAEYWGQEYLASDRWVRTMDVPERARLWYRQQTPAFRQNLDAFAAGINDYVRRHGERINDDVEVVLPVSGVDVVAHAQHVINFNFIASPRDLAAITSDWDEMGSNAWAIAPAKSASGHAMLLANPHLPWFGMYLFYEAQLNAPGVNAYGATFVGFPVLGIAFNDNLGWTHTVNTYDGVDHYELTVLEGGYRWDGSTRPFDTSEQVIKVKLSDGSYTTEKLVVKSSIHGPVVREQVGRAIALRVAGLDRPGLLKEWWDMARARNLAEFEMVLRRLQIPLFNVIYADRRGHIMYLFNGVVPMRPQGDCNFWRDIVPGDSSTTLWTRTHPYTDLPKVIDPKSHWLQNTNDPPWTTTFPRALDPNKFPAYMSPRRMGFRSQRSVRMLTEDARISFEKMLSDKYSTRVELADRVVEELIRSARRDGREMAKRAADVLEKWDRQVEANSRGALLFSLWAQEMGLLSGPAPEVFMTPWDEDNPLTTPNGLAEPEKAVDALVSAANALQSRAGSLDLAWGDVARLQYGKADLPGNGAFDALGVFRVIEYAPERDGRYRSVAGDSYVAAVEFTNPIRARVILGYGNSSQPDSPHRGDQLEMSARKQLRTAWLSRPAIEAHLESREMLRR